MHPEFELWRLFRALTNPVAKDSCSSVTFLGNSNPDGVGVLAVMPFCRSMFSNSGVSTFNMFKSGEDKMEAFDTGNVRVFFFS